RRSYLMSGGGVTPTGAGPLRNSPRSSWSWNSAPTSSFAVALPRTPSPRLLPTLRRCAVQIGFAAVFGQALRSPLLVPAALAHENRLARVSSRENQPVICQSSVTRYAPSTL